MTMGKGKILVVDDDPFVAEMLVIVLEDAGHAVTAAGDGREALAKLAAEPDIALVLTDMNMPGMDGLELTREIRTGNTRVPVLVLSARDDDEFRRLTLDSGAQGCLVKDEEIMERIADEVAGALRGASITT